MGRGEDTSAASGDAASSGEAARASLEHFPRLVDEAAHPKAWEFPAYLKQPEIAWLAELERAYAEPITFPSSLSPEMGLMLHSLVRNIAPTTAIEIGTFMGVSSLWIASALAENGQGVLHSFDVFAPIESGPWREGQSVDGRLELVRARLARAGVDGRVVLHEGDSSTSVNGMHPEFDAVGGVQFAFIDGDHAIPGASNDFVAVDRVLNTGGTIVLHDTIPEQCGGHEGPRHLIEHANELGQGRYEVCELYTRPLNYGMAVLRRIG